MSAKEQAEAWADSDGWKYRSDAKAIAVKAYLAGHAAGMEAVRKLAVAQTRRLCYGGGSVVSGESCKLCDSYVNWIDEKGDKLNHGELQHEQQCPLAAIRTAQEG